MEQLKQGKQSIRFPNRPVIRAYASAVGRKEDEGPLRGCFDVVGQDTKFGQKSWEAAERFLQQSALETLLKKTQMDEGALGAVFAGDLLNQCISTSFTLRNRGIPTLGLYGACSTMAEALVLGGACVNAGYADNVVAMTSSHFASSERQFRFPLGYGGQRTPTSQWTVTGAGAVLLAQHGHGPRLTEATVGTVVDLGIKDANNMGAAMAPAAYETVRAHFLDFSRSPKDYDLIVTGDLGALGKALFIELFARDGIDVTAVYEDCGLMIFDLERQDVHCGGSGCGCSAAVLCGSLLKQLAQGSLRRLLFCGTGALLSPVSTQQKESIPSVCHAVCITADQEAS